MIRLSALFWLILVAVTGFATFKVKYAVQDIDEELNRVRKQTLAEQQEIHILQAEWTALNQPERLAELNRRFLSLTALAPKQLQHTIEEIPLRPVPPPPIPGPPPVVAAPPDAVIAAAPETPSAPPVAGESAIDRAVAALAIVKPAAAKTVPRPQLAKVAPAHQAQPRSLDQLIAQIAQAR